MILFMNNRLQHPLFAVMLFAALVIDPCATDPRPGGIYGGAFGYLGSIGNYGFGYPRYGGYGGGYGGSYGKGYGGGFGGFYGNGFGYPNYGGYGSYGYNTPFYGR